MPSSIKSETVQLLVTSWLTNHIEFINPYIYHSSRRRWASKTQKSLQHGKASDNVNNQIQVGCNASAPLGPGYYCIYPLGDPDPLDFPMIAWPWCSKRYFLPTLVLSLLQCWQIIYVFVHMSMFYNFTMKYTLNLVKCWWHMIFVED